MLRHVLLLLFVWVGCIANAQCPVTGEAVCNCATSEPVEGANPELEILIPWENGPHVGFFLVELKNIDYIPELATNAGTQFNIGVDLLGDKLRFGEGHIHGWVFAVDRNGHLIRTDGPVPRPTSYLRFYGAGGAEFYPNSNGGLYYKADRLQDLPTGNYKVFFQAQQNDHTAMTQINAPAFPAIASKNFWVFNPRLRSRK
jgi:hypothetical protein